MSKSLFLTFASLAFLVARAAADDFDVRPIVVDGRITTNGFSDAFGDINLGQRVFVYDFQQDPGDPFFTSDPGFNAASGSGLPAGSQVKFNVPSAADFGLPANLSYWDGSASPSFGSVPAGESLLWNLGSNNLGVGDSLGFQAGFLLQVVSSTGAMHKHLGAFLNGSGGNDPANGIYLIPIELTDSDPSITKSKPFFILYNNGLSEAQADAAANYVQTHVIPEPSAFMLAAYGVATVALAWRKRRTA